MSTVIPARKPEESTRLSERKTPEDQQDVSNELPLYNK